MKKLIVIFLFANTLCNGMNVTYSKNSINQQGVTILKHDVSINEPFQINTSNATLDMNGKTIRGGILIAQNLRNIIIKNGMVDLLTTTSPAAIHAQSGCENIVVQEVKIRNGERGIFLDGVTDSLIDHCEISATTTALCISGSAQITVDGVLVQSNLNCGFCLISSHTCVLQECKAISTGLGNAQVLNNEVFGFVSSNGSGNIFERCIANATQALSTTDFDSVVAGIALRGTEQCSKIIECESANAQVGAGGVTVPYGILLEKNVILNSGMPDAQYDNDTFEDPQVSWSPDGKFFVAAQGDGNNFNQLIVFEFDRIQLEIIERAATHVADGADMLSVSWGPSNDYIAIPDSANDNIYVYRFERINNTLSQIAALEVDLGDAFTFLGIRRGSDIEWSADGRFLAVADARANVIVYTFDQVALTLEQVAINASPETPVGVSWSPDGEYIAIASLDLDTTQTGQLQVYQFDMLPATLDLVASTMLPKENECVNVAWSPNGKWIAALGSKDAGLTSDDNLYVFGFERSSSTLEFLAEPDMSIQFPRPIACVWNQDSTFIAVAGNPGGIGPIGNFVKLYEFDPGNEIIVAETGDVFVKDNGISIDWSPDGQYIVVGDRDVGVGDGRIAIHRVFNFPAKNVIKGNTVYCNSGGVCPQGVGISGSSIANLIIQNTAYSNPLMPFAGIGSNYHFVANVFDQRFGQGPTLLQNISIDCDDPICMPEDIALILKQAKSKTCYLIDVEIPELCSVIDAVQDFTLSSSCDATPILQSDTPTILAQPGHYCLAEDISGSTPIDIQSGDVVLDLNNHVVSATSANAISIAGGLDCIKIKNGVVQESGLGQTLLLFSIGTESSRIEFENVIFKGALQGLTFNGCTGGALIKSCKFEQNASGLVVFNSSNIVVDHCIGCDNQSASFALVSSSTCCMRDCKALSTGVGYTNENTPTSPGGINIGITGFISRGGYGNIFERCIANATQGLTVTGAGSFIAGFVLMQNDDGILEQCSKIIDCESANASASPNGVTVPHGILLEATINSDLIRTTTSQDMLDTPRSSNWSPDGKYIAVADSGIDDIVVYQFDRGSNSLSRVAQANDSGFLSAPLSSEWSPDGIYIAVADAGIADIVVYQFDRISNSLSRVAQANDSGFLDLPRSSEWSPDGTYIAVADQGIDDIVVYQFDRGANSLSRVAQANDSGFLDNPQSANWSPDGKYIAVADSGTTDDIAIYEFDRGSNSLSRVAQANDSGFLSNPDSTEWSPDGKYIAVADSGIDDIVVYQFDRGVNSLIRVAQANDSVFLNAPQSSNWSPDGTYIAVVDDDIDVLIIYEALSFPTKNVIKGNTVYCNSTGGDCPRGVGISGSSIANLIIQNTSYSNPLAPIGGIAQNYQFVTNVFNQQFGIGPSALQNIGVACDEPICQPEDLGLLLTQIKNKVDSSGCAKIPITSDDISGGTISITQAGSYCMATDLTADMLISATCVSVDLNNRILTGNVTIQNSVNAKLYDGRIVASAPTTSGDAAQAAITIASSALRTRVENVYVRCADTATADVAGRAGIDLQAIESHIMDCTICAGDAGDSAGSDAPDGGDGIIVQSNAQSNTITGCLIKSGAGGDSSASLGGAGGHGVNVHNATETKILNSTIFATGAGGAGAGGSPGGIGGHGVNVQDGARKTMITKLIIRDTGISGLPESMIDVPITEGGTVSIALRSRAINDLIPVSVSGISSVFANTAYKIYDSARPYIFQSAVDSLSQGNPSELPPLANEKSGSTVTGWSPISNVVFQSAIEVLS